MKYISPPSCSLCAHASSPPPPPPSQQWHICQWSAQCPPPPPPRRLPLSPSRSNCNIDALKVPVNLLGSAPLTHRLQILGVEARRLHASDQLARSRVGGAVAASAVPRPSDMPPKRRRSRVLTHVDPAPVASGQTANIIYSCTTRSGRHAACPRSALS